MNEMDDQDNKSIASDFSILPEANEVEAMSLAQPFLAADSSKSSASGSYNQVEFVNVCSNYPATQDLLLYYRFVADHTPVVTDRLALYRVGFTSPQHYLVYEWAPRESLAAPPAHLLKEGEQQAPIYAITFRKASLPRDAAEFYQVCYVSEEQSIRGVSSPFQLVLDGEGACSIAGSFGGASNDILTVIEQADGTILITSDIATLHTNINMLQETVQQVREEKESVERELTSFQTQLQGKLDQLAYIEQTISELRAQVDEERASSAEAVAAVVAKLQQAEQERNGLQDTMNQARDEVCRLQEETLQQQKKEDQLTELLLEREQQLSEYLAMAEGQKQCLEVATNQLQALAQKQELLESELQQCVIQRDEARQQVQFWTEAASADKSVVHQLQDKCHTANEELLRQLDALQAEQERADRAEDQTKAAITDLEAERAALVALQELLKDCQQELQVSEERRKVLDADNRSLQHNLRSLQIEADELKEQLRESCSAREGAERVAEQLSSRHQDVERQRSALEAKNKTLASKCSKLSRLILEQNVTESVEALVGLHDGDSTAGDDDDGDCVAGAWTTSFGMFNGAATLTTATSSLAALELSGSVDSRMNTMLEELLRHVRQLKTMMNARTDAAGRDAAASDCDLGNEDGTEDGLAISVVEAPGAKSKTECDGAVSVVEVTGEQDGTGNEGNVSVVEITREEDCTENGGAVNVVEVEKCEQGRQVEEALAAAESAMETLMEHAKLLQKVEEVKVEADPTVVAEANAEAAAAEVLQKQIEEETEVFVDAPTRPSSIFINMESIPHEQTVEQQVLQKLLSQKNVEAQPESILTISPQESVTEPTPEEPPAQQQHQQPAPQQRPDPSCYYGPVFTSGQTAPVFFPQRSTNYGAAASGHSSYDSNSAGVGGHAFPPFVPPQFAPPIALPYPPIYPIPLPPSGFHPYPPPCSFHPMPPPPPAPFHPMPPPPPVAPQAGPGLPPPLLPEKTEGARHAALLSTISAAAAQAIHNITSGLTPPASEAAPSEAGSAAPASAAAATGGLDDGDSTNRSTTSSTDTGFASNGRSGEAGSNNAGGFHYNRSHMRWQYGRDGPNLSWGMGFAGNGEARAEVSHGYGGGYCHRFGTSTTEQQQNAGQDQLRSGLGTCTDFMGRMNQVRDRYQQSRQMQHQACQIAQQAAQQQRMHMRAHRSQLRGQCIQQREEQRNMARGNATTAIATAVSNAGAAASVVSDAATAVSDAATAVSDAATAVSNAATVAVSNVAAAVVVAASDAASALAAAVNATVGTPAANDGTEAAAAGADAEQPQQLYEEDVEGDAPPQREDEATRQQSSRETSSASRSQEADDGFHHCPMCPLKFGKTSSGLLEEHINSHLEFICPVCNTAFQRSQENEFTAHVETHFDDEDYVMPSAPSQEASDPSGPWARSLRFMETD